MRAEPALNFYLIPQAAGCHSLPLALPHGCAALTATHARRTAVARSQACRFAWRACWPACSLAAAAADVTRLRLRDVGAVPPPPVWWRTRCSGAHAPARARAGADTRGRERGRVAACGVGGRARLRARCGAAPSPNGARRVAAMRRYDAPPGLHTTTTGDARTRADQERRRCHQRAPTCLCCGVPPAQWRAAPRAPPRVLIRRLSPPGGMGRGSLGPGARRSKRRFGISSRHPLPAARGTRGTRGTRGPRVPRTSRVSVCARS